MRKALALTLILTLLAGGGLCAAFYAVDRNRDTVELTVSPLAGDPSEAEGLSAVIHADYDRRLFWDTAFTAGQEGDAQTVFTFEPSRRRYTREYGYPGVRIDGVLWPLGPESEGGLGEAYRDLQAHTEPNAERTEIIRVADYYETYPLAVQLDFPNAYVRWEFWDIDDTTDPRFDAERHILQTFEDCFRIPVLPDEQYEISVRLDEKGEIVGSGGGSTAGEAFIMETHSVLTDSACYFTFDAHAGEGTQMDTSLLTHGYGIYRLPYDKALTENGDVEGILVDEMTNVFPLDPADVLLDFAQSPDGSRLLLHQVRNGAYVLTVIDLQTMTALQTLSVCDLPADSYWIGVNRNEDFLAVLLPGQQLALLAQNADGTYDLRFLVPVWNGDGDAPFYLEQNTAMAYDGKRLAAAPVVWNREGADIRFCLTVYDETGLIYCGEYRSSLETDGNACSLTDDAPVELRWNTAQ
ncbi:hypothetical protein JQM60_04465 [Butyricicoccus pullicaecorum]|nr:hypothetical protein [Butyricicoccus pullicaecorum]